MQATPHVSWIEKFGAWVHDLFFGSLTEKLEVVKFQDFEPKVEIGVKGFSVTIARKVGSTLQARPKDCPENTPYTDCALPEHFEVTINYDGSNPLYNEKPRTWTFLLVNAEGTGSGLNGHIIYRPLGERFVKIEIIETFEDWQNTEILGSREPDPAYVVYVHVFVDPSSNMPMTGLGLLQRPFRGSIHSM